MREATSPKISARTHSFSKGILAFFVLIIILLLVQFSLVGGTKGLVKGVKTQKEIQHDNQNVEAAKGRLQGTIEEQLYAIKKKVTELDPQDIVQSSPQVQKIIDDLKNLQGVPKDELKNVCENICKGI